MGPTGCGKSTTLALVSGLTPASSGEVLVQGKPVSGIGDNLGYVFQGDVLVPWKSVLGNVSSGLRFRGVGKKRKDLGADEALALAASLPLPLFDAGPRDRDLEEREKE